MKRIVARLLVYGILGGYGFWVYNAQNAGVYSEGSFTYSADCESVRTWVQSLQPSPSPSATPTPSTGFSVSPKCYMQGGQ